MFTGIIQSVGQIAGSVDKGQDKQLTIDVGDLSMNDISQGDSIAVNGVCLTAVAFSGNTFAADVSVETLRLTTLGALQQGSKVNLELALTPSSRLGGHLVSGHVDGVGEVLDRRADARSERFTIRAPKQLMRYIAAKGSVCVQGISLTVNTTDTDTFSVNIVPHTLQMTNLGECRAGSQVNLEIDVIARYLERLLQGDGESSGKFRPDRIAAARQRTDLGATPQSIW